MASDSKTATNKKTDDNSDAYLGQPIDRRGKTLTDEQAAIFHRYNQWKNNLMCLYNHIESYALPYPARTVQFLPNPQQNISSKNQYPHYTNCPFIYPSHCTVPKQDPSASQTNQNNTQNSSNPHNSEHQIQRTAKMTPIYYLQSMNYFVPNRLRQQQHLRTLFQHNTNIDLSNISAIEQSALMTGILPYDQYYHAGPCVESAYDVYRLRVMPQAPHLIATRSYHEDIAIYWLNYNHLPSPLTAFTPPHNLPERSGHGLAPSDSDNDEVSPKKAEKASHNDMDITVGTGEGYLIAVGQTSSKTKTGWGLAFNYRHPGMFITGNSDGSIACWDLNMVDNAQCMSKMGKFKNKKHSADASVYMKDSKINGRMFEDGPPFITRQRAEEYHWFEEFEKYGAWNSNGIQSGNHAYGMDVMSLDWCHDSAQIFVSSSNNGQISIWDRRSVKVRKSPQLWTWGTSHNQSILSVSWNPIQHSLIASGDKANKVRIWDIRSFNRHIVQLSQHDAAVYHVKWCPYNKYLLASSSADTRLLMYDLRRSGLADLANKECEKAVDDMAQAVSEQKEDGNESISKLLQDLSKKSVGSGHESGCPELVFAHYGHTACIPEFDWCPSGDLTIISTDMDGIIQTWQPPNGMLNTFSWVLHSQKLKNNVSGTDVKT